MTKHLRGDQLAGFSLIVFAAVFVLTAVVFVVAALVMSGGFERAWEVLVGIETPFGDAPVLGLALSALGYLIVPAVIGLAVVDIVTRFVQSKLKSLSQVEADVIVNARKAAREEAAKHLEGKGTPE